MAEHRTDGSLNVLIITEEDVFYVYEFFRNFFPLAAEGSYTIKGISICAPFNKKSPRALAKQMYGFYGPFYFVIMGFLYVWKKLTGATIEKLSRAFGIAVIPVQNVNNPQYVACVKEMKIDIIVSIAAPQVFRSDLLQTAKLGCINSHTALLPENRGMMPVFWAMYKGAEKLGVTVHYMNENLDSGDIIRQEQVTRAGESLHRMILKTKQISARLIHETLLDIADDSVKPTPMPMGGSYQTFPTPAEVKEFKRRGNKIF